MYELTALCVVTGFALITGALLASPRFAPRRPGGCCSSDDKTGRVTSRLGRCIACLMYGLCFFGMGFTWYDSIDQSQIPNKDSALCATLTADCPTPNTTCAPRTFRVCDQPSMTFYPAIMWSFTGLLWGTGLLDLRAYCVAGGIDAVQGGRDAVVGRA